MSLNGLLGAGTYVDSASWTAGLMAPYAFAYPQPAAFTAGDIASHKALATQQQQQQQAACLKAATPGGPMKAASDTLTWLAQPQFQLGAMTAAQDARWTIAGHSPLQHPQQPKDLDDAVIGMLKGEKPAAASPSVRHIQQRSTKQHRPVHRDNSFTSFTSGQVSPAAAATAHSAGSHGTHAAAVAAFTAAAREAQVQSSTSNHSGSHASPAGMLSPAAFVHNAQQMLLQQQQQLQQLQHQQMLLGLQQQHEKHTKHQPCQQQLSSAPATSADAAAAAAAAPAAGLCSGAVAGACSPHSMRAALGDRAFFSIRSLLMKQQEAFVQQLYELHRLVRVQHMACSEVQDRYHSLTQQYSKEAVSQLECSQSTGGRTFSKPTVSSVTTAAAAPTSAPAMKAVHSARQQRCILAGERPTSTDDGGAAAVAALPLHAVLLGNLPSSMRAAVSAPATSDCAALNPARYYLRHSSGVSRPLAARAVTRSRGKGVEGSAAAAVATTAPTVSDDDTVQMEGSAAVETKPRHPGQKQQQEQQQQLDYSLVERYMQQQLLSAPQRRPNPSSRRPTTGLDRPPPGAAAAAVSGRPSPSRPPASPASGGLRAQQQQQQQQMPPPPPMLPELAAQHVAAAAAQHQQLLLQQQQLQQQVDAAGDGRAAAAVAATATAGLQATSGLNVFRPMPQINPSFASKFLAGGHQRAATAAMPVPRFDPHSYWMKKHYGAEDAGTAASSGVQESAASGTSTPAAAAAAAVRPVAAAQNAQVAAASVRTTGTTNRPQQQASFSAGTAASDEQHMDRAAAAAAPRPVVQWWQDAAATFGDVGLLDPNTQGGAAAGQVEREECSEDRSGSSAKRMLPKYSVQQLPHKKRVKLAAAACDGWDMYGGYVSHGHYQTQSGGIYPAGVAQYGYYDGAAAAAAMGGTGAQGLQQEEGAFRPVMRQPASKERSRVRSNHMGSSRQGESVCSDNSASSIDNPNASVAAGAVYGAELGPDADGVSLLLHMGINAGRSGAAQTKVVQPAASAGNNTSASAAPSGISGQATARSAAALLMSLSGSHG